MNLKAVGAKTWDCIHLAQDRGKWEILWNKVVNFCVP
jgi:hypothetical protein